LVGLIDLIVFSVAVDEIPMMYYREGKCNMQSLFDVRYANGVLIIKDRYGSKQNPYILSREKLYKFINAFFAKIETYVRTSCPMN
jgi:hypothetical protein